MTEGEIIRRFHHCWWFFTASAPAGHLLLQEKALVLLCTKLGYAKTATANCRSGFLSVSMNTDRGLFGIGRPGADLAFRIDFAGLKQRTLGEGRTYQLIDQHTE